MPEGIIGAVWAFSWGCGAASATLISSAQYDNSLGKDNYRWISSHEASRVDREIKRSCLPVKNAKQNGGQDAARMTPAEQDLSLRGTVSQGEVSCGVVLKSSGRNTDNGDICSTPL